MKQNNGHKQVRLSGAAGNEKKKKPFPWEWVIVAIVPVIALLSVLGFLYVIGTFESSEGHSLSAKEMVTYEVTPENIRKNVSYYAVGITGEESTDQMDAVAVLCFDRKANAISVVQMPVITYLGKDTGFAVKTVGDVWGNPQSVPFCSSHLTKLKAEEITKGTHVGCGAEVEMRPGSASEDFIRVFNQLYGLPIDNFVVIPRAGLAQLIDELGGVDVKLSKKATLAEETYKAGVQTLSGKAAVEYITTYSYKKTVATDRSRMLRQREVLSAVLQRISARDITELVQVKDDSTTGIFGRLMIGSSPIRFNSTSFGKEQLLNLPNSEVSNMKATEAIARFVYQLAQVPQEKITFSILPGQGAKAGSTKVYSVNRQQTIALLNDQMNPYGLKLNEDTVTVQQVAEKASKADLETATLASVAQPQTGTIETEEEAS
ncbi:MAG: LytR family transcriptional regulator [Ruminococcaceae bacterium]|nr:LytR family transcriptional regulator [Oscillospiraceae bacterium]